LQFLCSGRLWKSGPPLYILAKVRIPLDTLPYLVLLVVTAHVDELTAMINHLGTQRVRAKRLIDMSRRYLQDPPSIYDLRPSRASSSPQRKSRFFASRPPLYPSTPISHLPGAGTYALDSYRIFCTASDNPTSEEWKSVMPTDKELIRYLVSNSFKLRS